VRRTFSLPPTDEHGASVWDAEVAVETMYARLPRDIARAVAERLRPGSSAPDRYQPGHHSDLPGRLILATEDEFFDPEWSRRVASAVLATEPIEITAGHFPMLERPADLARLLDAVTHIAGATPRSDAS
jgi:pimeloyl-ACP methyl ester carboxylesterase